MPDLCSVADACGGCPLIRLSVDEQRQAKLERVVKLLDGAGLQLGDLEIEFDRGPDQVAYRNRIRLQVREDGEFGFFNAEKDPACAVLLPGLKRAMRRLEDRLGSVRNQVADFAHLEVRTTDFDGHASVFFVPRDGQEAVLTSQEAIRSALCPEFAVGFAGTEQPSQRYPLVNGVFQYVPLGDFMQVNFEANARLIEAVVQGALARGVQSVVDLYCGAGNFLLPLLSRGIRGVGVEINEASIAAARRAAQEQGVGGTWLSGDVEGWLQLPHDETFDLAVVDPPRAGLGASLAPLVGLRAKHLAVCSCNPKTLACDLAGLIEAGYAVESFQLFDMFPHTKHVEALVFLRSGT